MDTPIDYISYLLLVNAYNFILMAWTYRSSNINYCCFCWQYKKYTTKEVTIDESVVCYKCFPGLVESAEEKRRAIMEDSTFNNSREQPHV